MKKILSLMALLLMLCSTANAQYMLKVQYKNGTHDLYEVDCTENVEWEADYTDPNKIYMSVFGRLAGQHNTSGLGYPIDMIENMTIVGSDPKTPAAEQSTFQVDEQTNSVNMVNYSIEFGPSAIQGTKTLTVNRIDDAPAPAGFEDGVNYMTTYDFNLEGVHDLKGVVEIRIPVAKKCYAAYLNEETGEWDPVLSYYDNQTHEMVIISDHLSTYSVFDVTDEHTRAAKLQYWGFDPQAPADIEEVVKTFAKVAQADNPNIAAFEAFANDDFQKYSLGLGVFSSLVDAGGFDFKLLSKYNDIISRMGQAWSIVQIANSIRVGDDVNAANSAYHLAYDLILKPQLEKKLFAGNWLFPVCMTAVAVLEFEINWFATTVHETATSLYENAYQKYMKKGSEYPTKVGYGFRSSEQWYDLIYPLFIDRDNIPSMVTEEIDQKVTDYVNQPWHDADGFNMAVADSRGLWPFWVEISDKDRRAISQNHRQELYSGTLKSVIQNINRKYLCKTKEKFDEIYKEYVQMMNKIVNLRFKDSAVKDGEKSKFAGCKIRFKRMPNTITDPEKWECTVKDDGTCYIQFRMYPYLNEGFDPVLEVVDKEDAIVGEIDIKGIEDIGKYYEVWFDLSNKEDMDLKDKWNITLEPQYATIATPDVSGNYYNWGPLVFEDNKGFESHARGTIPGDIYGLFNGIVEAFEERTLNLDGEGNFSIQHNGLNMTGNYNARTKFGTGKFTLKSSSHGANFVTEHQAFEEYSKWAVWYVSHPGESRESYHQDLWTYLDEFDATFSVEGTAEIYYSNLMDCYVLHLDGIGSYTFDGEYFSHPSDGYIKIEEGKSTFVYKTKNMEKDDIYVKEGSFTFSPTLIYK